MCFLLYCHCFLCFPVCRLYLDLMPLCKTHISKMHVVFQKNDSLCAAYEPKSPNIGTKDIDDWLSNKGTNCRCPQLSAWPHAH